MKFYVTEVFVITFSFRIFILLVYILICHADLRFYNLNCIGGIQ
jgi:hypothetical protein